MEGFAAGAPLSTRKIFLFVDSGEKSGIEYKASLIVASFFCSVRPRLGSGQTETVSLTNYSR